MDLGKALSEEIWERKALFLILGHLKGIWKKRFEIICRRRRLILSEARPQHSKYVSQMTSCKHWETSDRWPGLIPENQGYFLPARIKPDQSRSLREKTMGHVAWPDVEVWRPNNGLTDWQTDWQLGLYSDTKPTREKKKEKETSGRKLSPSE